MSGKKLQQTAAECAEGLPGTALEHPLCDCSRRRAARPLPGTTSSRSSTEKLDVHKVAGKSS